MSVAKLCFFFPKQKAVNITSMLLAVMKEVDPQSSDERGVNVLAAVREFEEFGTDYGKQHKNFTSATYRTGNLGQRAKHFTLYPPSILVHLLAPFTLQL